MSGLERLFSYYVRSLGVSTIPGEVHYCRDTRYWPLFPARITSGRDSYLRVRDDEGVQYGHLSDSLHIECPRGIKMYSNRTHYRGPEPHRGRVGSGYHAAGICYKRLQ